MPELDAELVERVARWCAEAGRTTVAAEIRRALAPLGWEELLATRALLADPPPARPLGPFALADLARGTPADVAADREREGRYPHLDDASVPAEEVPAPAAAAAPLASAPRKRSARGARSRPVVIRRARDATPPSPAPVAAPPLLDELLLPEGRSVLERLVRRHGARRPALVAALAAGWRTALGHAPGDADLSRLLDTHGLARAFARRERDELLHALRAAGGLKAPAAARLGMEVAALDAALERTGARAEAERIREARRGDVRARATLTQRVRLLLGEPARLEDLGLLAEIEDDLRRRLPEQVRAVGASGAPALHAFATSLSISPAEARGLADRFGLALGRVSAGATTPPRAGRPRAGRPEMRTGSRSRPGARPGSGSRPGPGSRSGPGPRSGPGSGSRPGPGPRSGPRSASGSPTRPRPSPRPARTGGRRPPPRGPRRG